MRRTVTYTRVERNSPTWLEIKLKNNSPEQLRQEAIRVLKKDARLVPVYVDRSATCTLEISPHEHLVPRDMTMGQFVGFLRRKTKLSPENALLWFVGGNTMAPLSFTMGQIYDQHKEDSLILHLVYCEETSFG